MKKPRDLTRIWVHQVSAHNVWYGPVWLQKGSLYQVPRMRSTLGSPAQVKTCSVLYCRLLRTLYCILLVSSAFCIILMMCGIGPHQTKYLPRSKPLLAEAISWFCRDTYQSLKGTLVFHADCTDGCPAEQQFSLAMLVFVFGGRVAERGGNYVLQYLHKLLRYRQWSTTVFTRLFFRLHALRSLCLASHCEILCALQTFKLYRLRNKAGGYRFPGC